MNELNMLIKDDELKTKETKDLDGPSQEEKGKSNLVAYLDEKGKNTYYYDSGVKLKLINCNLRYIYFLESRVCLFH
jgi:hypothetical protein